MASRRQTVLTAIDTELRKITVVGGFNNDIGEVAYIFKRAERVHKFPAALIHTGGFDETKERFPTRSKQAELVVVVTLYMANDVDGQKLMDFIADVEKTIEDDPRMGQTFIIDTILGAVHAVEDEDTAFGPVNRADVEIRCVYRHPMGSPAG
ncbi:hypothetical protein LCGC14_0427610 [marine sediment metagenome]|uniref:Uncharacterized protein n=1 Tax=marine sediment metagenome TaxID=412755 RepID=A0A0F9VB60_9ZZZZ